MKGLIVPLCVVVFASSPFARQTPTGTIKGHVHLIGKRPGNPLIRMGMDPKCAAMNRGKQVFQESVRATADGSLADAFVRLEGTFPATPVPTAPVTLDQHSCVYTPRVVGVRVGQVLQIRNSDNLLHNVHSLTNRDNRFNFGQARAGVVDSFRMKNEEVMMRLGCDIHRWMTAYVGVVSHPYFAVTDAAGIFEIKNVPSGTYTLNAWQESFGTLNKPVKVTPGRTVTINFAYTAGEKSKSD